MSKRLLALVAPVLVTAFIATGCGGDDEKDVGGKPAAMHTTSKAEGTDSGSSALRSTLTAALTDHVYLAGLAINTGVGEGLDSKAFESATGTLDNNSKALADAIGSVYGDEAGDQFLALWRAHIGFFVDYTKGKVAKDDAVVKKARADLDGYRAEFGAFLESANPKLTADAVAEELVPHVDSVFAAIRSVLAKNPNVYERLREAASHMPNTANVLAGAITKQMPDKFSGSADSGASTLRATLTHALSDHVYLAGLAVATGVGSGLDSKAFKEAAGTLDGNSQALADAIGRVYGDEAGKQFLALWRDHITFFVDYAKAKAGGDGTGVEKATAKLDGYRAEFGAFLESANPNLTADAVAEELVPHVDSVFAAIDAVIAKRPDVAAKLAEAASHMPQTANVLAGAIAKQMPDKFPSA